ncbi:hypothetical protein A3F27_01015 [Candidatus Kaiserbacteria bacterium RIFCSPHIGHO2_12_FULL_53_13]|uniref:Endonuclease/exonuclease/phosphatase domain-containing protein n=1 Tax=Candidatus Kaiserbacteria bacterium RIFCSPHIGHO2_12_FULL_53_13 TaxID=1798502 RepID=A0A1F6E6Y2_9BACT|nr:MAG: hypothetical protein A3F27_01015 [Candidatus Kaiserbacteria bacterium RIFCSPHIGHO2_12_FULL_53_13]OGG74784.1 MAG: hypothetical protein A3A37_00075 [Candidatus Kaiserbacteria bacterium RIFCSPLOWO2_01_FULL_52_36]
MPPRVKLISLNVEGSQHLDLVLPFLEREMPDIATIQELNEEDIPRFSKALGGSSYLYGPMARQLRDGVSAVFGIGIFSRLSMRKKNIFYYHGGPESIPDSDFDKPETYSMTNRALAICDAEKEGVAFRIVTTHFTWSPEGQPTELQREDMRKVLWTLDASGEFVLTGDFNAPRGGEIFNTFAGHYKDNVPASYTTSIDGTLHRAGQLPYMVDGLFSTPGYTVSDVEMVSGLSDHCALRAMIGKTN